MRIRRYTGKDAQEAMLKVKMDLGSDAVIISTRKVKKKGMFGMFAKPLTEILAAVDEDYGYKKTTPLKAKEERLEKASLYNNRGNYQPIIKEPIKETIEEDNKVLSLENKVKQMESLLEKIYSKVSDTKEKEATENPAPKKDEVENQEPVKKEIQKEASIEKVEVVKKEKEENTVFLNFKKQLLDYDIEEAIIDKMTEKISQLPKTPENINDILAISEKIIANVLGEPQIIKLREDKMPTVVMLVGPTGVGKTTTLAKIAADYSLNHQKKVALITADTYRIAAVEQLKTYAEILNLPVSVIYTPSEVKQAIQTHNDKDLILIDTAGRSHKNTQQFSELKALVSTVKADETYLVLSSNMSKIACREILAQYQFLSKYKLIFTKLDEVNIPGIILNARYSTGKPLSYITAGQSVPDDIEIADVNLLAKSIIGKK